MTNHFVKDKENFNIGGIKVTGIIPLKAELKKVFIHPVIHKIPCAISLNMKAIRQSSQETPSSSPAAAVSSKYRSPHNSQI